MSSGAFGQLESQMASALSGDEVAELAKSLIRIPSVNPPGKEKEVAEFTASWFEKRGFDCEIRSKDPIRPNVVVRLEGGAGGRPGPSLLFNTHMDVVPVGEGWTHPPFDPVKEDRRLFGRGSCDTKGGMAAMMLAMDVLRSRAKERRSRTLTFQCVADEETGGSSGSSFLARDGTRADFGIVAEPTDLAVCTAHKGDITFELTTKGSAAHASLPKEGHSAIADMNRAISELLDYGKQIQTKVNHPLLGSPTVNVGVISGGLKSNIIPDRCWIAAERRVVPPEEVDQCKKEIESLFTGLKATQPGFDFDLQFINATGASEVSGEHKGVKTLLSVLHDLKAKSPAQPVGFTATCDAYFLNKLAGVPTVIIGPGSLSRAHTRDEYVDVEELGTAAKAYAWTALRFLAP